MIVEAWRRGRLPHAWVLTGPRGVGKATLAYRLARRYLAGDPSSDAALDPTHPVFRQILSGAHPDFHLLQPRSRGSRRGQRGEEKVAVVRELIEALLMTSLSGGGRRVLLVDDVDLTLNREGYNALLKLLEEPPPGLLFLLVDGAIGRLAGDHRLALRPPAAGAARGRAGRAGAGARGTGARRAGPPPSRRRCGRKRRPGALPPRERLARQLWRSGPDARWGIRLGRRPDRGRGASPALRPEPGDRHGHRARGPAPAPGGAGGRRPRARAPISSRGRASGWRPWQRARALIA